MFTWMTCGISCINGRDLIKGSCEPTREYEMLTRFYTDTARFLFEIRRKDFWRTPNKKKKKKKHSTSLS